MDKEIAQYVNTLLAEKEREVKKEQLAYNEISRSNPHVFYTKVENIDPERMVAWGQELSWERHMIYKAQKSMDYIIEEEEGME